MLTWLIDYWYLAVIALAIGVATGWWIWGRLALAPAVAEPVAPQPAAAAPEVPIDPVPTPVVEPVAVPVAAPRIAVAVGADDDLELIKGIGPVLDALLHQLGVRRFDQIAAWTAEDIAEVDGHLGSFKGRIVRDKWVDQAGYLARGDKAGFEALYGPLGSEK